MRKQTFNKFGNTEEMQESVAESDAGECQGGPRDHLLPGDQWYSSTILLRSNLPFVCSLEDPGEVEISTHALGRGNENPGNEKMS